MKPLTEVRADLGGGVIVRRGTPLVDINGDECIATDPPREIGGEMHVDHYCDRYGDHDVTLLSEFTVDLTDATGRAHVAWAIFAASSGQAPELACTRAVPFIEGWSGALRRGVLADLDPNDNTRIPEGSRWVDAEALARVAVHVLGGAS